jgi:hypothetical protein
MRSREPPDWPVRYRAAMRHTSHARLMRFSLREPHRSRLAQAPDGSLAHRFLVAYESNAPVTHIAGEVRALRDAGACVDGMTEADLVAFAMAQHECDRGTRNDSYSWDWVIHHPNRSTAVWRAITGGIRDRGAQAAACTAIARYADAWLDGSLALTTVRRRPLLTLRDPAVLAALPTFSREALASVVTHFRAECGDLWYRFLAERGVPYAARLTTRGELPFFCGSSDPTVRQFAVQLASSLPLSDETTGDTG